MEKNMNGRHGICLAIDAAIAINLAVTMHSGVCQLSED